MFQNARESRTATFSLSNNTLPPMRAESCE
jgi:hypothetical protein